MTNYEKRVRKKLLDKDMTLSDLEAQVTLKTGLYCDNSYMSRIFNGKRNAPKIKEAISEILGI